jgi:hypothetical protein
MDLIFEEKIVSIELTTEQYDDTPWTELETAILAGIQFGKLDETDYSDYLFEES